MQELIPIAIYLLALAFVMFLGDRLGTRLARRLAYTGSEAPIFHIPTWMHYSAAIITPGAIVGAFLVSSTYAFSCCRTPHLIPSGLYAAIPLGLFFSGLLGGFMDGIHKRQ